ncbi:hypothetical protein [Lactovum odontotermitis]
MALTDRQNAFCKRIHLLLSLSSSVSIDERVYLEIACDELKAGRNFKKVINDLNLRYKELESWQTGGLTTGSKKLRDDLIEAYGEPVRAIDNWKESDPDYIFSQRAWIKRGEENPYRRLTFSDVFSFACGCIVPLLIILAILFILYKLGVLN